MKKRLITVCLAVLMMLLLLPTAALAATSGDYEYDNNGDGTCTITDYNGNDKDISIPSTLDGLTVTKIGDYSLRTSNLTSVIIPSGVTCIGNYAFDDNDLASATIPDTVTSIGDMAFSKNNLTSINIPDSVVSIGYGAFNTNEISTLNGEVSNGLIFARNSDGNDDTTKIVSYGGTNKNVDFIPSSVTEVGDFAFEGNSLTAIVIPNSVKELGISAFASNSISSVNIPSSITEISENAFYINNLQSVDIPDGVTSIRRSAFGHNDLESVVIPSSVTFIGEYAFTLNDLQTVSIPGSVRDICEAAFMQCKLTSITLGNGIEYIGPRVFQNNKLNSTALSNSTIPSSVKYIGANAFSVNTTARFILPTGTGEWTDGNDNSHQGGDAVTDLMTEYFTESYTPILLSIGTSYTNTSDNDFEINYTLREQALVTIRITDASNTTINNVKYKVADNTGNHTVYWNGNDKNGKAAPSGIYNIVAVAENDYGVKYVKKSIWNVYAKGRTVVDQVKDGKLNRKLSNPSGSLYKTIIYYGSDDSSAIYKINYYTDDKRTSYRLFNTNCQIKNFVQLNSAGKVEKTNYYNVATGVRTSYKLYDAAGRTTHLIYCHPDGNKPKKTNYYNVSTGVRKSYKLYDTQGRMTHYATCYSDGLKANKMNYYDVNTGKRTAYKTYRTDGSCSCHVECDSNGNPSVATYYDKNGKKTKVVRY